MIPFKYIPQQLVVPGEYAEIDNSQANIAQPNLRALLIGSMTSAGSAAANVPSQLLSPTDAGNQFGFNSMLADMARAYIASDNFGEVWGLPLADAGTAATGSISFAGTATAAGALSLYIASDLVTVNVTSGMTAAQLATAVAAAVSAVNTLQVTAAVDGETPSKVDFTAVSASLASNDIDIGINYGGAAAGQATPAGITPTIVAMSGGLTNPVLTTALANLGALPFEFIVCAYNDSVSMTAMAALMSDATGRWSYASQLWGQVIIAYRGTVSATETFTSGLNSQHIACMPSYQSPSPVWRAAAGAGGQIAVSARADPGVPIRDVSVPAMMAPAYQSRFSLPNRNALILDGCCTYTVDSDNNVILEKMVTTYVTNAQGQPDQSYRNLERMFLIPFVLRALKAMINTKYSRCKLAADPPRFAPGSNIVTPLTVAADMIAQYRQLEFEGYVQNSPAFAAALQVAINAQNPGRLDALYPAALIEQLDIVAILFQFRLQ
jgi:phage tail sheath gpL-like